jgi:para-aminobenzoate synthetase/4-amino-4-deoxychorismate lyase
MEIIADLESTPRRIYTGTIGFLAPGRRAQLNVAIRTILLHKPTGRAEYGVGGGIVWDSTPAGEYEESLTKTRVLTPLPRDFDLLET